MINLKKEQIMILEKKHMKYLKIWTVMIIKIQLINKQMIVNFINNKLNNIKILLQIKIKKEISTRINKIIVVKIIQTLTLKMKMILILKVKIKKTILKVLI